MDNKKTEPENVKLLPILTRLSQHLKVILIQSLVFAGLYLSEIEGVIAATNLVCFCLSVHAIAMVWSWFDENLKERSINYHLQGLGLPSILSDVIYGAKILILVCIGWWIMSIVVIITWLISATTRDQARKKAKAL